MRLPYQLLGIFMILGSAGNCYVLASGSSAVDEVGSPEIPSQSNQHTTSANISNTILGETTFDADWVETTQLQNLTTQPLNAPSQNLTATGPPQFNCNGKLFGRNLNLQSCLDALASMESFDEPRTYGERGAHRYDVNLPFRFLGYDGLCAIDISHRRNLDFDTMMPSDMKTAVAALISICVRGVPSVGGTVSNLGVHGGLSVRVTPYRPIVSCGRPGTAPPALACREVLDFLPTTGLETRFGPVGDLEVDVPVPKRYTARGLGCGFTVDTVERGMRDASDWYKLWAAAVAVEVMCVEVDEANGAAYGLGKNKWLYVKLERIRSRRQPAIGLGLVNGTGIDRASS